MSVVKQIKPLVTKALKELYNFDIDEQDLTISATKPEFEGDYTLVLFSFVKSLKKSPDTLTASGDLSYSQLMASAQPSRLSYRPCPLSLRRLLRTLCR